MHKKENSLASKEIIVNKETLAASDEVVDDLNNPYLIKTTNKEELEKALRE